MKKFLSVVISVLIITLSAGVAVLSASAAETTLRINDNADLEVGDKVTYTVYLADTTEPIIGFELRIFYDNDYLKYVDKTLTFDKFDGVVYNTNLEDMIAMSWTNVVDGAEFSEKGMFLSAQFEVLKGGETEISQFITEIYGDDMTYLKSFTWTYDLTSDGKSVAEEEQPPVISEDDEVLSGHQGQYINFVDGQGDANSPNAGQQHEAVVGNYRANTDSVDTDTITQKYQNIAKNKDKYSVVDLNGNQVTENVIADVTKGDGTEEGTSGSLPIIPVIAGIVVAVIIAAGVIFALVRRKRA